MQCGGAISSHASAGCCHADVGWLHTGFVLDCIFDLRGVAACQYGTNDSHTPPCYTLGPTILCHSTMKTILTCHSHCSRCRFPLAHAFLDLCLAAAPPQVSCCSSLAGRRTQWNMVFYTTCRKRRSDVLTEPAEAITISLPTYDGAHEHFHGAHAAISVSPTLLARGDVVQAQGTSELLFWGRIGNVDLVPEDQKGHLQADQLQTSDS